MYQVNNYTQKNSQDLLGIAGEKKNLIGNDDLETVTKVTRRRL